MFRVAARNLSKPGCILAVSSRPSTQNKARQKTRCGGTWRFTAKRNHEGLLEEDHCSEAVRPGEAQLRSGDSGAEEEVAALVHGEVPADEAPANEGGQRRREDEARCSDQLWIGSSSPDLECEGARVRRQRRSLVGTRGSWGTGGRMQGTGRGHGPCWTGHDGGLQRKELQRRVDGAAALWRSDRRHGRRGGC